MEKIKLNNENCYETIMVVLREDKCPIAHKNKVEELMEQGAFDNIEEAKEWVNTTPIELELIYEKNEGLFAIESEAVICYSHRLCSPYTKAEFDEEF